MSNTESKSVGKVEWFDLTNENAEELKDFYSAVIGWDSAPVSMGDYHDYNMIPPGTDAPVTGICHARETNAGLPPMWLIYITVADLETSINLCRKHGGEILVGPNLIPDYGSFCVIRDPAGAVAALFEKSTE